MHVAHLPLFNFPTMNLSQVITEQASLNKWLIMSRARLVMSAEAVLQALLFF